MNKKVVWLPYDFDTALGINNEGALVFSYNLEDTDHLAGGANVFNGQESVVWINLREAFGDEIKAMYQQLRSDGELSYEVVEQMFEAHQDKWSEAIFNEDSYFKYLAPLVAPDAGKEPTAAYLAMLQGSKKEQRKWWMYNRFRYMDSKYNAGDALSDVIQLRGYAKANVTVTPYADVYASVKYGSYLVQQRAERNVPVTLVCPLDKVNDTEIYIYSASQLADIGDISGLQVGFADFSMGTKLQTLKVGDSASGFSNANLKELYLGNNALLKTLDVRNCVALGTDTQKTVDISGCTNIENVYFDGTAIQGLTLPNGGVLKVLHLPSTITNLTIMNQLGITDLTIPSYANISTLRLENTNVNSKAILMATPSSARVRIIGFAWEAQDATEIDAIFDKLDTMRGLDETGGNVDKAQVSGTIHTSALTGAEIAEFNERYPFVTVSADHISCQLNYYSWDGQTLLESETVLDGGNGSWVGTPARPSTAQYLYTFVGWNTAQDASVADANATKAVTTDRNIYAAYSRELRHYTATFVRASEDGGGTLWTQNNIPYGTIPTYGGATPTTTKGDAQAYPFDGWNPSLAGITGDTTYTAKFKDLNSITRKYLEGTLTSVENSEATRVHDYAFFSRSNLSSVNMPNASMIGSSAFGNCYSLSFAGFPRVEIIGESAFGFCSALSDISMTNVTLIGSYAFWRCKLSSASLPNVTSIGSFAFQNCSLLQSVYAPNITEVRSGCFAGCSKLANAVLPNVKTIGDSAFSSAALTAISLPKADYFGISAFRNCRSLMSVYLLSTSVPILYRSNTFEMTPMIKSAYTGSFGSIYVPASLVDSYKSANIWSYYSARITAFVE